jgi:Mce-associated membrane protein
VSTSRRFPSFSFRRIVRGPALPWALAALATAAAVIFALLWLGLRGEVAPREEVASTARGFLLALTNFDAATIDRDVEEIRSYAVGDFAREVEQTFSQERIQAIRDSEATSVGRIRDVFVQSVEGATATAFGVVNETVQNTASPAPTTDVLRVELVLVETAEGWRVSSVQILQSPAEAPF